MLAAQARRQRNLESRDDYTSHNAFWVPARAPREHLLDNAKQPGIGQYLDEAMDSSGRRTPPSRRLSSPASRHRNFRPL